VKILSSIIEMGIIAGLTILIFLIIYLLGTGEKKEKSRNALLPFTSGEAYKSVRIPYKIRWIFYIALFTIFEASTLLLIISVKKGFTLYIAGLYVFLLLLALYMAPKEVEVEI